MSRALALDLGTTRVKRAELDERGALCALTTTPAPRPAGAGSVRELDADAYRVAVEHVLEGAPAELPLGIASQRSSFLLFDERGVPATPLVSWQDRRAAEWCDRNRSIEEEVRAATGLPLSPHYAGPKLATLVERDPSLLARMESGELRFGTLETWLTWRWSGGAVHATDLSMAARTLLVDTQEGDWSDALLERFRVPRRALPAIEPTAGRRTELSDGRVLAATIADQPAGLLAVLGAEQRGALVNLGTGSFVLSPTGARRALLPGYLSGPVLRGTDGRALFALEGTINGGGATADREAPGPTELPARDPAPGAFCLPDENGVGAPHWRPEQAFVLEGAEGLAPADRRRVVLEGLCFRVREILHELARESPVEPVLISGGLANEPFLPRALAACLATPVSVLAEEETTLLGTARLAAGLAPRGESHAREVRPPPEGAWLQGKYERWREWLGRTLG